MDFFVVLIFRPFHTEGVVVIRLYSFKSMSVASSHGTKRPLWRRRYAGRNPCEGAETRLVTVKLGGVSDPRLAHGRRPCAAEVTGHARRSAAPGHASALSSIRFAFCCKFTCRFMIPHEKTSTCFLQLYATAVEATEAFVKKPLID